MKKKIIGIFVMTLLIATALSVNGQVLDQSQQTIDAIHWLQSGEWQTFVPVGKSHDFIEVHIGCYYGGSMPITLSVERPLGNIVTFNTLPASAIPAQTEDWVRFYLNATFPKGELYHIVLTFNPGSEYSWSYGLGDPYPQGKSSLGPGKDFCFRTYVERSKENIEKDCLIKKIPSARNILMSDDGSHEEKFALKNGEYDLLDIPDGLTAHWKFENNVYDSSGNNQDGQKSSGVTFSNGMIGKAAEFTFDTDDCITVTDNPGLRFEDNDFTVSFWIKPFSYGSKYSAYTLPRIFSKAGYFALFGNETNSMYKKVAYEITDIGGDASIEYWVQQEIPLNTWTHVAFRFMHKNEGEQHNYGRFYINGVYVDTTYIVNVFPNTPEGRRMVIPRTSAGRDMYIGNTEGKHRSWDGLIDELMTFDRRLSGDEIYDLYKMGIDGYEPDLESSTNSLTWKRVKPNQMQTDNILIYNAGNANSPLDWEVIQYPSWGTWTIQPSSGDDLRPEDGIEYIQVSVVAPNVQDEDYLGKIQIVNKEDALDICEIQITLSTSKNKATGYTPFLDFLQDHPNMFSLLRQLLDL